MKLRISKILFPIFASCVMMLPMASCSSDNNAKDAYEQAEQGNLDKALQLANKAYDKYQSLDLEDLCRLSATFAALALNNGDAELADKFQTCYKASLERDKEGAEKIYRSLDPQMADGLALISGLLDGNDNFSSPTPVPADVEEDKTDEALDTREAMGEN